MPENSDHSAMASGRKDIRVFFCQWMGNQTSGAPERRVVNRSALTRRIQNLETKLGRQIAPQPLMHGNIGFEPHNIVCLPIRDSAMTNAIAG